MSIPARAVPAVGRGLEQVDSDEALAFIGHVDQGAPASFVWTPGERAPAVIGFPGHDGRQISLNAVAFVPLPDTVNTSSFFEDSAGFTLDARTWGAVRDALRSGTPLRVPTKGYFAALRIEWRDDRHPDAPRESSPSPSSTP